MNRLQKISLLLLEIIIPLAMLFYYGLKMASGHKVVWYVSEILAFILGAVTFLFAFFIKFIKVHKVLRIFGIALYTATLILSLRITYFMLSFDYDKDVPPVLLYILPVICSLCVFIILIFVIQSAGRKRDVVAD